MGELFKKLIIIELGSVSETSGPGINRGDWVG